MISSASWIMTISKNIESDVKELRQNAENRKLGSSRSEQSSCALHHSRCLGSLGNKMAVKSNYLCVHFYVFSAEGNFNFDQKSGLISADQTSIPAHTHERLP